MHDVLVQAAGILAFAAAVVHGAIAETKVFPKVHIEPARARLLIRLVWQCSTVAWMALATLLFVIPWLGSDAARNWIVAMSIVTFALAAIGNVWANRGRHFGWVALALVVGLAAAGL